MNFWTKASGRGRSDKVASTAAEDMCFVEGDSSAEVGEGDRVLAGTFPKKAVEFRDDFIVGPDLCSDVGVTDRGASRFNPEWIDTLYTRNTTGDCCLFACQLWRPSSSFGSLGREALGVT